MKPCKKVLLFIAYCLLLAPCAFSQDLHFSQFMNSPLATNPANTGFLPEGDYRLGINYRNQWASVISYRTIQFGRSKIAATRHIAKNQPSDAHPSRVLGILHDLHVAEGAHRLVWNGHHR